MNLCGHAIVVTGLVTAFAFPAYAANHGMDATMMKCADFIAMDAEGQVKSMEAMQKALDEMALDKMTSDEMAADEMAADEMAADEMVSEATASDEVASDMASDEMTAIASACEGNPDMMALDAMMSN